MTRIRKISFLLVLALLVLAISCSYADKSSGNYKYKVSSDGKAIITKYLGNETKVTVPSSIDGYQVNSIGDKAFYDCENIEEVILPDGIVSIGKYSFAYCEDLISFSTAATSIGQYAFKYCEDLKTITFTAPEVVVGEQAFYSCESLETVTGTIKNPGKYSFAYCNRLKAITIVGEFIDEYAFKYCEDLKTVTVLSDAIVVKEQAFYSCESLESFTATAKDIESYGFAYDKKLKEIVVSGQEIGEYAFKYCEDLQTATLITPITRINQQAFYSCEKLTTINGIVGDIDEYGFAYCSKLATVQFAGTSIADNALRYCKSLEFEIPNDNNVEAAVKRAGVKYKVTNLDVTISNTPQPQPVTTEAVSASVEQEIIYWICPNCNSNAKGNFCNNCGTKRPDDTLLQNNSPTDTPAPTETPVPTEVPMDTLHLSGFSMSFPKGALVNSDGSGNKTIYPYYGSNGDDKSNIYIYIVDEHATEAEYLELRDSLAETLSNSIENESWYSVYGTTIPDYRTDATYAGVDNCHYYEVEITYGLLSGSDKLTCIVICIEKGNKTYMFRISSTDGDIAHEMINLVDQLKWDETST